MEAIPGSLELVGYPVKIWRRPAFRVTGYTALVPPGKRGEAALKRFWDDAIADGRVGKLIQASSAPPLVLGLGSWDEACEKHGHRYTICIEETAHTDFRALAEEYPLFTKEIGASDWLCFEMSFGHYMRQFWRDDPYKMMPHLGYQFHTGGYAVGLHFEAYPPSFPVTDDTIVGFWITVVRGEGVEE